MNKITHRLGNFFSICLIVFVAFLSSSTPTHATQYQQCPTNSNCSIGEFLYNDEYQPIAIGATCTLTSRYPNGDLLVNSENMPGTADGWYSYSVGTSGLSNGVYRGQMCCTSGSDYLCLDKSFEITSTLSSLVFDVWDYPTRSLNSFSNLISGIWGNPTRQLTSSSLESGGTLATTGDLDSIGSTLITLSTQISAVQTDVDTIDSKVTSLQTEVNNIQTDTTNILLKWGSYSVTDILNYVDSLETQLGNNTQTCSNDSVFGHIQCLIDKWGTNSASTIYTAANNAYTTITSVRSELGFNGKSTTAYDEIIALKAYVDTIETSIGSTSDTSSISSIFGRIKQVKEAVDTINDTSADIDNLLTKWGSYSASDIYDKVKDLSLATSAVNTVNNVSSILTTTNNNYTTITEVKNQVIAMKALLDVNRLQLEALTNKPIVKSWLEEGSIIFKNLITNPSALIKQKVPFVYYLPPEVKQNHIIKKSDDLEIKYDPALSTYYATGNFELGPKETLIVMVEVEDIWSIPKEKIDSLRSQANELYSPLKNTSYFAQGATLHSDILASLDRIIEIQKNISLPEDRIKAYRDAQIELDSVNRKIDSLKSIVSSAGSIGTLSGFIGGVQTLAVWGIVVILVAGFVFLALYIRSLNPRHPTFTPKATASHPPTQEPPAVTPKKSPKKIFRNLIIFLIFGLSSGISSALFARLLNRPAAFSAKSTPLVLSASTTLPTSVEPSPTPSLALSLPTTTPPPPSLTPTPKASASTKVIVIPAINSYVNLRSGPDRNLPLVTKILSGQELEVITEKYNDLGEKWFNISYNQSIGWILAELTQAVQSSSFSPSAKVNIIVPDRDTVLLYSRPSYNASITYKITEKQSADILVETQRWAKVILSRVNLEGWVSQDFIEKIIP